ncbi:MAG TPA: type II toxin-antitoxin system prevent-host-death family antitoxin [Anaerolineales bacterium]|nr:type II toxin-antitoxin system prevent-host-death family antitoxin [Anaerolineales bacterium]
MVTVGIRELKQQTSELIRLVRETGSEVQVTYHGKVVALLVPVNRSKSKSASRAWTQLDSLAAEISVSWKQGVSAAKAVSEGRR